jgi:hypothetical protein
MDSPRIMRMFPWMTPSKDYRPIMPRTMEYPHPHDKPKGFSQISVKFIVRILFKWI